MVDLDISLQWIKQINTLNTSANETYPIVKSDNSYIYLVYESTGSVNGDTNSGFRDIVASKLDHSGNVIWTRQKNSWNNSGNEIYPDLAINNGNIYFSFYTQGIVETTTGGTDIVIVKLDNDGNTIWERQNSDINTITTDFNARIDIDNSYVYLAYESRGVINTSTVSSYRDIIIVKLDQQNGNVIWRKQDSNWNTTITDAYPDIKVYNNNIYFTYFTQGTLESQTGGTDNVIVKLDKDGNIIWAKQNNTFNTITTDRYPRIDVFGDFLYLVYESTGKVGSSNTFSYTDLILVKFDVTDGSVIWANKDPSWNTSLHDLYPNIEIYNENIYLIHYSSNNIPGGISSGNNDVILIKVDSSGNTIWTKQKTLFNTSGNDVNPTLSLNNGNIYLTYSTDGTINNETSSGGTDIVVSKILDLSEQIIEQEENIEENKEENIEEENNINSITYYVSSNGDNNNDGSLNTPYQTINYAISQCNNGDLILLLDNGPFLENTLDSSNNKVGIYFNKEISLEPDTSVTGDVIIESNVNILDSINYYVKSNNVTIKNVILKTYSLEYGIKVEGNNFNLINCRVEPINFKKFWNNLTDNEKTKYRNNNNYSQPPQDYQATGEALTNSEIQTLNNVIQYTQSSIYQPIKNYQSLIVDTDITIPMRYKLESGSSSTLGITNGQVFSFGDNFYGECGTGNINPKPTPSIILNSNGNSFFTNASEVAGSWSGSSFVLENGKVYGFGRNSSGNLGLGYTSGNVYTPTEFKIGNGYNGSNCIGISVGNYGNFGFIILDNGKVLGFGEKGDSRLGTNSNFGVPGSQSTPIEPVYTTNGYNSNSIVTQISGGNNFSVMLLNTGKLLSCGKNSHGRTGRNTTSGITGPFSPVTTTNEYDGTNIVDVCAGASFFAALTSTGQVLSTGYNGLGALGIGNNTDRTTLTPLKQVNGYDGSNANRIYCGYDEIFVILNNGKVLATGNNFYGKAGIGITSSVNELKPVINNGLYNGTNCLYGSTGNRIGTLLTTDGYVMSAGMNGDNYSGRRKGILGNGTLTIIGQSQSINVTKSSISPIFIIEPYIHPDLNIDNSVNLNANLNLQINGNSEINETISRTNNTFNLPNLNIGDTITVSSTNHAVTIKNAYYEKTQEEMSFEPPLKYSLYVNGVLDYNILNEPYNFMTLEERINGIEQKNDLLELTSYLNNNNNNERIKNYYQITGTDNINITNLLNNDILNLWNNFSPSGLDISTINIDNNTLKGRVYFTNGALYKDTSFIFQNNTINSINNNYKLSGLYFVGNQNDSSINNLPVGIPNTSQNNIFDISSSIYINYSEDPNFINDLSLEQFLLTIKDNNNIIYKLKNYGNTNPLLDDVSTNNMNYGPTKKEINIYDNFDNYIYNRNNINNENIFRKTNNGEEYLKLYIGDNTDNIYLIEPSFNTYLDGKGGIDEVLIDAPFSDFSFNITETNELFNGTLIRNVDNDTSFIFYINNMSNVNTQIPLVLGEATKAKEETVVIGTTSVTLEVHSTSLKGKRESATIIETYNPETNPVITNTDVVEEIVKNIPDPIIIKSETGNVIPSSILDNLYQEGYRRATFWRNGEGVNRYFIREVNKNIIFKSSIILGKQKLINFVLDEFDDTINMTTTGTLPIETVQVQDASAIAVINMDISYFTSVFKFSTDSSDILDISGEIADIKYFVESHLWDASTTHAINPTNASLDINLGGENPIYTLSSSIKNLIKHDFIRYIAKNLFNTHFASDLFNNETQLLNSIEFKGLEIASLLKSIINQAGLGKNNIGYFTNADTEPINLSREFLKQIITYDKIRLDRYFDSSYQLNEKVSIPFVEGDTVVFKLIISPPLNQHKLLNINNNVEIPPRSYLIKIKLFDNANYIIPVDSVYNGPNQYSYPVRI